MKFATLSFIAFAGVALAAPVERLSSTLVARDIRKIEEAITLVHTSIGHLCGDLNNRQNRPRQGDLQAADRFVRNLLDTNTRVLRDIQNSDNAIFRDPHTVALYEVLQLQNHLNGLKTETDKCVQGWLDIKPIVDAVRLTRNVHDALQNVEKSTGSFADSVVKKLPTGTGLLGNIGRQAFVSSIDRAVQAYRR